MTIDPNLIDNNMLSELQEITAGEPELLIEIIEIYQQQCPELIAAITSAIATQDMQSLVTAAHSLKGISYNVGAVGVGNLAKTLETHGNEGVATELSTTLAQLENIYNETSVFLETLK
ncbi:Hpt domain-containing protein [Candidatus Venteria ishoeyi]|uniref:Aerobic respiration control sensor protein ArcB n=1 Tax=Candidatus Venteria ishoeyi TaxID=1899563 RepID=A0A1H6F9D9_9GAMM|nr:Hpt domain-containing protein [Candidatus Venteria ishoeyi]MDM8548176.1 Hpt domain-containing protein [Candidatus Venteria ishoeyi]SEH05909.1 aerobic respiration control sensor protein ArcB [Candidatus Venteria ishoeyi]